jgi:hypothetical protein
MTLSTAVLAELARHAGPRTLVELAVATGISRPHVKVALRRLFDDGRVAHDGWTRWRVAQTCHSASDNNEREPAQSTRAGAVVGLNNQEECCGRS